MYLRNEGGENIAFGAVKTKYLGNYTQTQPLGPEPPDTQIVATGRGSTLD
jgi:hypothetical protein